MFMNFIFFTLGVITTECFYIYRCKSNIKKTKGDS